MSQFICRDCHVDFKYSSSFARHQQRLTPCSELKFQCDECERQFKSKETLQKHRRQRICMADKEFFSSTEIKTFCIAKLPKLNYLTKNQKSRWSDLGLTKRLNVDNLATFREDLENEQIPESVIQMMKFILYVHCESHAETHAQMISNLANNQIISDKCIPDQVQSVIELEQNLKSNKPPPIYRPRPRASVKFFI